MACTSQSALEYIRSARRHLVGRLKNISVIVENLYQKKVFSEEQVSKIQSQTDDFDKTRKILDWVMNKGEVACYELLKIIDVTRKRTLERPVPLPEPVDLASPQTTDFDLHHWISCFPFREDTEMDRTYLKGTKPCNRYQAKLKSKAKKLSDGFWTQSKKLMSDKNANLSYTELVLARQGNISSSKIKNLKSKKSKKIRPKKLKAYIPADKRGVSPSDLLKTHEKNILVVGKPGIGKTAVTHQILKLWAESDNMELDYMFYFDMRETSQITSAMSLEDFLFGVISEPDEGREEVLQDIKRNSENVTIIFDGITDVSCSSVVRRLIEKSELPEAKMVITCRPEVESEDFLLDWASLRVEVEGFSEQSIKAYLSKMLNPEHLSNVLNNLELFTLCHVPMYALMVAACFSFKTSEDSQLPCTVTEIYISILRFGVQNSCNTKTKQLNPLISSKREEILSLAEVAFHATGGKSVTALHGEDSCVHLAFLKTLGVQVAPTEWKFSSAFLHYTMQEFFSGLWLLKDPENMTAVFQQCLTGGKKHMKHVFPFMCGLLNEKNLDTLKCLIPAQQVKETSQWFFKKMLDTFLPCPLNQDDSDTEDCGLDVSILFLCQCLYESQSSEACLYLLKKLDYLLDLSGESLDPYHCCAVSYVISQSKERKIRLNLEDVTVAEQGLRLILGCLKNVQWCRCDHLQQHLWKVLLLSEGQMDYISLLGLGGNELHLPVSGERHLFERAVEVMQKSTGRVNLCIHWDRRTSVCPALMKSLLEALPCIYTLRFAIPHNQSGTDQRKQETFLLNVCLQAALHERETIQTTVAYVLSLSNCWNQKWDFLLDLYSHVKDYETQTGRSVLPALQPVYQSAPAVWTINLSERKASLLLEVLKLQSGKKPVELTDWSDEESEVWSFLQCLPYMSRLRFAVPHNQSGSCTDQRKKETFLLNVCLQAALHERETIQTTVEKVLSLSNCWNQKWDFLLDLYSHVKDYETQTGRSVLPALQPVYQSAPAVWTIKLSERKASLLLEVLKLQSGKKPVELTGCSDEESEVWSFLQCLPYMSRLSFLSQTSEHSEQAKFLVNLFCKAAEWEQQTGAKMLQLLSSVCRYQTFPLSDLMDYDEDEEYQCDFLLDLCSHVKDYETQTGRSVLPALQPVYQSAPAVWTIKLSERKASLLLEVLKLQSGKKPVELTGCSDEESEVWSFLQCLPYMSRLSFLSQSLKLSEEVKFLVNLFCKAAEWEQPTGEKILQLLSSVCRYETFPVRERWYGYKAHQCDFLLDLYSHVKDYETQTGRSVLPALQPVYQSAPAVWTINLSERKASLLLEVLKLQPGKKPVELTIWSDAESEVWSFLQCLPYMSRLSFRLWSYRGGVTFLVNLFCKAAEWEQQTGEKILQLLSSVCRYEIFPDSERHYVYKAYQCDFLLDLYSHVKDYETQTGRSVLPALQPVYQSAPAVWTIKLSERKASLLLEVLKLQSGKKPVELTGCSDEESEVWSFLQCLPYMSRLSFLSQTSKLSEQVKFLGNLFCKAAEWEQPTGEKILQLLSSVCRYQTFPLSDLMDYDEDEECQCDFLLDLCSHVKDYETQTGRSVLPALQPVYQSAPAVWTIKLQERKASLLLEVLKLQSGKKPVKLTGWSGEESEVWSFLQCLPYMSRLRCDPGFFQSVCASIYVRSREETQQLASLLQLMGFSLVLTGELPWETCWTVGRVLGLCGSSVDLILRPSKISLKGASLLFRHTSQIHSLRLSESMALLLSRCVRTQRVASPLSIEELSLVLKKTLQSERVLLRTVSSLASLLRYWTVKRLNLTEFYISAHHLMTLLLHHGPLKIKLHAQHVQQLTVLIHEIQDKSLAQSFLSKVGGDLTSCSLDWEILHYLLQQASAQSITVDLRKSRISEKSITDLLPLLDRILFKRPSPSFVLSAIRESYKNNCIPSLLRSLDHHVNLTSRDLDTVDCAALVFSLKHSDGVKLNLLWSSIPPGEVQPLLFSLENVSHLSVDRKLLLRFLRCCTASEAQQGAAGLLRTLQHRLDLSCSSCVELSEEGQVETLCLTAADCKAISTVLRHSSQDTLLNLQDCEVEDSGLDLLFPVLDKVRLSTSKALLVQLVSLVPVGSERDTVRRAESLCGALGGQLDLSETTLDQRACAALVRMLEFSEGLEELDLSHCQLTDQLLHTLIPHLHKAQVLDLSHNKITDALTDRLLQLVSINTSIHSVRVFSNSIVDKTPFLKDRRFEMW